MEPLAIDLQILRSLLLPDLKIVPGRALMARVVQADGSGRGSLSIAGYLLEAELPKDVDSGQDLRLVVRDVTAGRVLLAISPQPDAAPAHAAEPAPASPPVPLPGGGTFTVTQRDEGRPAGAPADSHALTLRYDAPALGPIDLRFELDPASLRLGITLAQADADSLRAALVEATGRAASVTITPRREPLNVYA
jgi:hypothetical protein